MKSSRRCALALALVAAACGDSTPPPTSVEGSVSGTTFATPSAFYFKEKASIGVGSGSVDVLITDELGACGMLKGGVSKFFERTRVVGPGGHGAPSLWLQMDDLSFLSGNERTMTDGDLRSDFDPGVDGGAIPSLSVAESGHVHLQRSDDPQDTEARAVGTFEIFFPDGGVHGTFNAQPCAQLRGGCDAGGSGLALIALPLLAVLRRRRSR